MIQFPLKPSFILCLMFFLPFSCLKAQNDVWSSSKSGNYSFGYSEKPILIGKKPGIETGLLAQGAVLMVEGGILSSGKNGLIAQGKQYGVFGQSELVDGIGLLGMSNEGVGVKGFSTNGYAGVFGGRVFVGKVSFKENNVVNTTLLRADEAAYTLFVTGGILAEEVKVRTGWADYVFEKDYNLMPLGEVKQFIYDHGHLPNMPSAATVENDGLELGDMTTLQQEKLEELFLHAIKNQERLEQLEKQMETLQQENATLKRQIESLN